MKNLNEILIEATQSNDHPDDVSDIRTPDEREYIKIRDGCITTGLSKYNGDFYIQMMYLKNPLDPTGRNTKTIGRAARGVASPTFKNDMWKYRRNSGVLELLWALPSLEDCMFMLKHKEQVLPQDYPLLEYVIGLFDGTLDKICDAENEKAVKILHK